MLSKKVFNLVPLTNKHFIHGPTNNFVKMQKWSLPMVSTQNAYQMIRNLTTKSLNQSLEIATHDKSISIAESGSLRLKLNDERPLAVLLVWLMSQKKHIYKYAKYYLDNGFDVLTVRCTPWQLLWPVTGSQIVAGDLLKFLHENPSYTKTVLHGFSVGCYLWGEVLEKMSQDLTKYTPVVDRIAAQIWDSPVDYYEIPIGVPKSVFPTNEFLRKSLERYVIFHMKTYQESATKHHLKSTAQFYNNIVTAPSMFLFSLNDPMVNLKSIEKCRDMWLAKGISVNLRAWDKPPHVGILQLHPEQYQDEVRNFIEKHVMPFNNHQDRDAQKATATS